MTPARVVRRAGPLVVVEGMPALPEPHTLVWIGSRPVPGQVILQKASRTLIFVCGVPEVRVGDPVLASGARPVVLAGPGWLGQVHELQFPLQRRPIGESWELVALPPAPPSRPPRFYVREGDQVSAGAPVAEFSEGPKIRHLLRAPVSGTVVRLNPRAWGLEPVAVIEGPEGPIPLLAGSLEPLHREFRPPRLWITFQRTGFQVLDFFFPLTLGSIALLTGARGTGKTPLLQHLARFGEQDLVVYVADRSRRTWLESLARTVPGVFLVAECEGTYRGEFLALVGRALAEYYQRLGLRVLQITDASCEWLETMEALWQALEATGYEAARGVVLERVARCLGPSALDRLSDGRVQALTHILATRRPLEDLPDPLVALIFDRVRTLWRLDPVPGSAVFPPLRWTASYATHAEILQQKAERLVDEEFPEVLREIRRLVEHYESLMTEAKGIRRPEDRWLAAWIQLFQRHFWHQPSGQAPMEFRRAAWFLRLLMHLWDWSRAMQRPVELPDPLLQAARQRPLENPEVFQQTLDQLLEALSEGLSRG